MAAVLFACLAATFLPGCAGPSAWQGPENSSPAATSGGVSFTIRAPLASGVTLVLLNARSEVHGTHETRADRNRDGTWTASVDLIPGEYRYFFVVDGSVTVEGSRGRVQEDDFGGMTGVVTILRAPDGRLITF